MADMTPRNCAELLAEWRAAGLGVYPGPGEDELTIIADEDAEDAEAAFARYGESIHTHKAALLAHFERHYILLFAQEEAQDIAHGKRFCRGDCPHLKAWRHNWPQGPGARAFWCRHAETGLTRLHMLADCPDRQTEQNKS